MPPFILPGPGRVAEALWESRALIGEHALVTAAEVLIGLVLGAAARGGDGDLARGLGAARALLRPILVFSQAIPVFALAPVLTLWLGYGLASKIAMALLIIYFPVTSAFFDGLTRTPQGWLDMARVMGARRLGSSGASVCRRRCPRSPRGCGSRRSMRRSGRSSASGSAPRAGSAI